MISSRRAPPSQKRMPAHKVAPGSRIWHTPSLRGWKKDWGSKSDSHEAAVCQIRQGFI